MVADCCEDEEETVLCEEGGGYEGHGRKFTGPGRAENSDAKHYQTQAGRRQHDRARKTDLGASAFKCKFLDMQYHRTGPMAALSVRITARKTMQLRTISASIFRVE